MSINDSFSKGNFTRTENSPVYVQESTASPKFEAFIKSGAGSPMMC